MYKMLENKVYIYNSLAPRRFQFNFRKVIFKLNLVNGGWGISYEIVLRWMPLDFADDKSTLVQVMAWCHQATSHYLSQCWPRSVLPYGVTRPQWVNVKNTPMVFHLGDFHQHGHSGWYDIVNITLYLILITISGISYVVNGSLSWHILLTASSLLTCKLKSDSCFKIEGSHITCKLWLIDSHI